MPHFPRHTGGIAVFNHNIICKYIILFFSQPLCEKYKENFLDTSFSKTPRSDVITS